MSREFRLTVTIPLASDEFEQAAGVISCGKLKASVVKAMEEHHLTGVIGHELVTPRTSTSKTIPAAPPSQNAPTSGDPGPVAGLSGGSPDVPADKPHTARTPPLRAA